MRTYRKCRICGEVKPYNLVYFVMRTKHFKNVCLECEEKYAEELRAKNREYEHAKKEALKRDHYRCVECGSTTKPHVHHKKHRSDGGTNDLSNLVTLCANCHFKQHKGEQVSKLLSSVCYAGGG